MDQLSEKILRYIRKCNAVVAYKEICEEFGEKAADSLSYLESIDFIKSGRRIVGISADNRPVTLSDGKYNIQPKGIAYLEEKPGKNFDRWLTRFCAIWGAITGTVAIIAEIWLHFL